MMISPAVELLEAEIPDRAIPNYRAYRAEVSTCRCGWDIFRCLDADFPAWLHMESGRPECGTDDLRRPSSYKPQVTPPFGLCEQPPPHCEERRGEGEPVKRSFTRPDQDFYP